MIRLEPSNRDENAVAIVRMENSPQQLAVPLLGRVAEQRLHLRADEVRVVAIADRVHPGHERHVVGQIPIFAVGVRNLVAHTALLAQPFCLPPVEASRKQARHDRRSQRKSGRDRELLGKAGDEEKWRRDGGRQDQEREGNEPRARGERPRLQHWTAGA